ncbi:hypothetical protein [Caballeronia sp. LZ016]|uniref:hypothetical protein n=1 Tax=Caballeronia sp. LZ016 TaxID=3038554 RepID=UPI002861D86F|nr:hypothetical protein [Caballeronia sp. LZ016]MDR5740133.1 hypothetical protein [Caballeronia sp. LZ016]
MKRLRRVNPGHLEGCIDALQFAVEAHGLARRRIIVAYRRHAVMDDEGVSGNEQRIDELGFPLGLFQECSRFHGGASRTGLRKRCAWGAKAR